MILALGAYRNVVKHGTYSILTFSEYSTQIALGILFDSDNVCVRERLGGTTHDAAYAEALAPTEFSIPVGSNMIASALTYPEPDVLPSPYQVKQA